MKIAVTGANGQLGKEIARQGVKHELILTDYDTLLPITQPLRHL